MLPRSQRLVSSSLIASTVRTGSHASSRHLRAHFTPIDLSVPEKSQKLKPKPETEIESAIESRFAVVAGKKVGKANVRNLVKRRIKSLITNTPELKKMGYNIVIIAKPSSAALKFAQFSEDFEYLVQKITNQAAKT